MRWRSSSATATWAQHPGLAEVVVLIDEMTLLDGLTDLDNLIALCHRHHHLVHGSGWRLTLDKTDRTLTVALADGSATRTMRPAGLQPPATRAAPGLPSEPSTTAA